MEKKLWLDTAIENSKKSNTIDSQLYNVFDIKRGLRNADGTGVIVGFTKIGSVIGYEYDGEEKVSVEGNLFYRDKSIYELATYAGNYGYERAIYLLLFGTFPSEEELEHFNALLDEFRALPEQFTENMILKSPSKDIMNKIQRSILVLYSHDKDPDNIEISKTIMQSLKLIARIPTIMAYGYQAKAHYFDRKSLFLHAPEDGIGTSKNILHLIRSDNKYSDLEFQILDLLLILHAEHGGGNNSSFATHVVSSTGTDIYSAISAAVGSLKGPKHGGANIKVKAMIDNIKETINYTDRAELKDYLVKILNREVYNKTGLIYGMGHAVYTKSDPRAMILKEKAEQLAKDKNRLDEFMLYADIESLTKEIFKELKGEHVEICANIDLYSGFVYDLLDIPHELYTPIFATARIASWCAHRIEQLISDKKIIRPAYMSIKNEKKNEKIIEYIK